MALTIPLVMFVLIFFEGLSLKLIGIGDNEVLSKLILIFILIILVDFLFLSHIVIFGVLRINLIYP